MKLAVFDLIEKTVKLLRENRAMLEMMAVQLQAIMGVIFKDHTDALVTITTRVKSDDSLREKILRKNLYKTYPYPEGIIQNLSDIIGLRVECRFLEDEGVLFNCLREQFTQIAPDGYAYSAGNPEVRFDLRDPQPQSQNNGFAIYRIDGLYGDIGQSVRFELQIKAMVHVFWAEVEHEIIYKNNSYMLMDSFMKELLSMAYSNLSLVDNQLFLIYQQTQAQSEPVNNYVKAGAVRALFAKAISDLFYHKMRQNLGFTLNFRHSCDILSRYILEKNNRLENGDTKDMFGLLARVNNVISMEIDFEAPLLLEQPYVSKDVFSNILADHLLGQMNTDYEWNLFFRMLFVLEPGNNVEDFTELLQMVKRRLGDDELYAPLFAAWPQEQAEGFKQWILIIAAHQMVADGTVQIIYEGTIETIRSRIQEYVFQFAREEPPKSNPRLKLWEN